MNLSILLASAASLASAAGAQDVTSNERSSVGAAQTAAGVDDTYQDIVVTAQRREQRLSDVPLSIAAVGGDALKKRNFNDVSDLAKLVTGLSVSDSGFSTPIYTLRGVGVNEPSIGSSSSVAVYLDQVPLAYPVITQGATFDLQRVEVLKGPQGTLYGQNATGGAINYIANRPTDQFAYGGTLTFGRFDRGVAEAFVSGPLSQTLKARLAARATLGSGWQRSITRDERIGRVENYTGRAIVEWTPHDRIRFVLNANGWLDRSDTIVPQLISPVATSLPKVLASPVPGNNPRDTDWDPGIPFRRDDQFWQTSLRGEIDLTDELTLTSITAYSHLDRFQRAEYDGIAAFAVLRQNQRGQIRSFSQELRLNASFSGVNWVLGTNINRDRTSDNVDQFLPDSSQVVSLPATGAGFFNDQKIHNWSVFTNLDLPLGSQLILSGGVRLSQETRWFEGCTTNRDAFSGPGYTALINRFRAANNLAPIPTVGVGDCVSFYTTPQSLQRELDPAVTLYSPTLISQKLSESNIPWNIALNWKPAPGAMIYGRISRGFKAGNFSSVTSTDAQGFQPTVQEMLTAYEVGGRLGLGRVLNLEGALFSYEYVDKQLRARINVGPPFGNINAQANIPKSRLQGAEVTATLRPLQGLSLTGSATYIDSKIREYDGFTVGGQFVDFNGARFNFTPKWSLNGDINLERPVSDRINGFAGVNVAYRSKTSAVFVNPGNSTLDMFDIPAYTLVDAQLGVSDRDAKWRAFIWGKNIFDKYYWTNVNRVSTVNIRFPGMPATYGVTVSFAY